VTLALLGSYACVSQLGEYDADEHGSGIEYIKRVKFAPSQTEELLQRISELHRTHRSVSYTHTQTSFPSYYYCCCCIVVDIAILLLLLLLLLIIIIIIIIIIIY